MSKIRKYGNMYALIVIEKKFTNYSLSILEVGYILSFVVQLQLKLYYNREKNLFRSNGRTVFASMYGKTVNSQTQLIKAVCICKS